LRGAAIGRGVWKFVGSHERGRRAAAVLSLIETCKLDNVDPQAWLAHVLARLPDHPAAKIDHLMPWRRKAASSTTTTKAPQTSPSENFHRRCAPSPRPSLDGYDDLKGHRE